MELILIFSPPPYWWMVLMSLNELAGGEDDPLNWRWKVLISLTSLYLGRWLLWLVEIMIMAILVERVLFCWAVVREGGRT